MSQQPASRLTQVVAVGGMVIGLINAYSSCAHQRAIDSQGGAIARQADQLAYQSSTLVKVSKRAQSAADGLYDVESAGP